MLCLAIPPYSTFETSATKIIKETSSKCIYLVIPTHWKDSSKIKGAIKSRRAKASILRNFDFLDADRSAVATVDLICLSLVYSWRGHSSQLKIDPFDLWFDDHFKLKAEENEIPDDKVRQGLKGRIEEVAFHDME